MTVRRRRRRRRIVDSASGAAAVVVVIAARRCAAKGVGPRGGAPGAAARIHRVATARTRCHYTYTRGARSSWKRWTRCVGPRGRSPTATKCSLRFACSVAASMSTGSTARPCGSPRLATARAAKCATSSLCCRRVDGSAGQRCCRRVPKGRRCTPPLPPPLPLPGGAGQVDALRHCQKVLCGRRQERPPNLS